MKFLTWIVKDNNCFKFLANVSILVILSEVIVLSYLDPSFNGISAVIYGSLSCLVFSYLMSIPLKKFLVKMEARKRVN